MPNPLPFPIRVAAGLVASGIDTIRTLPVHLPGMGVQLVGAVTKVGLRLQQEVSELAARGDELLESRTEPQEHPAWARFDDEDGQDATDATDAENPEGEEPGAADATPPRAPVAEPATTADRAEPDVAEDQAGEPPEPPAAPVTAPAPAGSLPLDGYDAMTIGQVRGHLRRLSRDDVRGLLEHEAATANRASFLTLLANRITTIDHHEADQ